MVQFWPVPSCNTYLVKLNRLLIQPAYRLSIFGGQNLGTIVRAALYSDQNGAENWKGIRLQLRFYAIGESNVGGGLNNTD